MKHHSTALPTQLSYMLFCRCVLLLLSCQQQVANMQRPAAPHLQMMPHCAPFLFLFLAAGADSSPRCRAEGRQPAPGCCASADCGAAGCIQPRAGCCCGCSGGGHPALLHWRHRHQQEEVRRPLLALVYDMQCPLCWCACAAR